ncbi:MAG: ABC transporter permease, partial [Zestosphaera sp.]
SLSSGRHPLVGMLMSLVFASLIRYAYVLQDVLITYGINVSNYVVVALPFTAAVAVPLIVSAIPQLRRRFSPPRSLGKIFFSEERSV